MTSPKYTHRKLPAAHIGLQAERGCTNCFFGILFILFWGLMIFVSVIAIKLGNLDRLVYGVDYLGNTCSKTSDPCQGTAAGCTADTDWGAKQFLWYPITFDIATKSFLIKDALKAGVCVSSCPGVLDSVSTYGQLEGSTPGSVPSSYRSLFSSTPIAHRCVPSLLTFVCPSSNPSQNFNISECTNQMNSSQSSFNKLAGISSALDSGFDELKTNWWVILACAGIGIVICFLWLFILRRTVKPMVVITMILVFIVLAGLGGLLYWRSTYFKEHEPNSDSGKYYFYGAIGVWVVTFLYLCLVVFLCKDIMVACDIIEEASKIPIKIPTMMLVPPVLLITLIPFLLWGLFVAANVYTAAKTFTHEIPTPNTDYNTNGNTGGLIQVKEYKFENWRIYAQLFNLFMFLWTMGFIHAIGFMIVAFCGVFWYWSRPGDDKDPEAGVWQGLKLTFRYHLGTLALGSMIIAILQILRFMLGLAEHRMRAMSKHATLVKFLVRCAACCLACFERIIKFINKNAYILTTMTGEPFLGAARHALSLLSANALSVGAVTIVGEYVMIFGKLLITAATCASCYGILQHTPHPNSQYTNGWLVIVAVGILTYFIACVFLNVFGVCIDVVLLSYCYDLGENDGMTKPYFFPSDLAKHVDRASERMDAAERRQQDQDYQEERLRPLNK